jgi:4-amino-4-deoxy-L-arabinose transferase-like glycosyltransferase
MALFGVNEIALRLPSLVMSTLAIVFTYQIGLWLFGARAALLAALFHAGNGLLIGFAAGFITSDHVDSLFVVLVELGVLVAFMWSRRPRLALALLVGVVVGLAVLTKLWAALVVIPIQICLAYRRRPLAALAIDIGVVLLAVAAIVAPWQMYIHRAFPLEAAWETAASFRHLVEPVEGQPTQLSYYLLRVPRVFGELVYVPLAWFLFRAVTGRGSREELALALWIVIPFASFSLAVSKSVSYLAIAGPALFLAQAAFVDRLASWTVPRRSMAVVQRVSLALLLALPLRFAVERLNPLHPRHRTPDWASALRALDGKFSDSVVLFGTEHPIEAMFSTRCTAYWFLPTAEQVRIVRSQGRTVAVCDDRPLPSSLSADADVAKVRCGQ